MDFFRNAPLSPPGASGLEPPTLRDYQAEVGDKLYAARMRGVQRPLVVMATGLGKTATAMSIPWRVNPGKMLFLADRRELLRQAWKAAKLWNPTLDVGLDHETYRAAPQQDLVIGSIPAIGAKNTKRLLGFYEDHFKTVFFDEAHHAAAATHIRAMKRFAGADQIIGLTATPFRHDGFDLANIFDEIVATYDLTWGMEHGWLVDVRSYFVRSGVDISDLETRGGDFAEESLELALNTDYRNSLIIGALNEYAFDRKSILIFAASTGHVKILVDQLNRYGWKAEGVVGATPKAERKEIFERFANGETRVMVGCMVPTEGYDNPRIDCIFFARPTKSLVLISQMLGRGLRPSPETGKVDCLLLDIVDVCRNKDVAHLSDLFGVREFDCMGEGFLGIQKKVKKAQDLGIDPESGDASSLDEKIKAMEGFLGGRIVEIPTQAVQIDLFKRVNTPLPEVDALSVFRWARDPNGTYILPAASLHKPKLRRDAVGNWTMEYQSPSGAIAEALGKSDKPPFKKADSIMKRILPETGKPWDFFSRNASWRNRPAQKEDIDRLRRYSVDIIPDGLTRGAAADAVALIKAQREG